MCVAGLHAGGEDHVRTALRSFTVDDDEAPPRWVCGLEPVRGISGPRFEQMPAQGSGPYGEAPRARSPHLPRSQRTFRSPICLMRTKRERFRFGVQPRALAIIRAASPYLKEDGRQCGSLWLLDLL